MNQFSDENELFLGLRSWWVSYGTR